MIVGQDRAVEQFATAWASRKLHHAWLLAGPRGVGKATFRRAAARRVLADAAGPPVGTAGNRAPPTRIRWSSWSKPAAIPDMRWLERLENEKTGNLNRNIKVDQVRELGEFMGMTAALSPWRVAVIDTVDDLEASARQCPAQDARGAAGEQLVLPRQPRAGAACCRRSARAAAGSISQASTMTP